METTKTLILVRHGESFHQVRGLTGGWTDTPLTDQGKEQAKHAAIVLANRYSDKDICLFSSDLLRARETTNIISQYLGVRPIFCQKLRELNNGEAKDKTLEKAQSLALSLTEPRIDWIAYPGAESLRAMSKRIIAFLNKISEESDTKTVLIVSHGNIMVQIVHWWLRLEEKHWSSISFDFDCGSITQLSTNEWGERVIVKLNNTSHLIDLNVI